jgi:putative copper resistance protein D
MSLAVILFRFIQFGGAAILFGSSLFFLYSPLLGQSPVLARKWTQRLVLCAAATLVIAAPLGFFLQTAELAGSLAGALDTSALRAALLDMNFGKSSIVRFALAVAVLAAAGTVSPGRRIWRVGAALGAVICASFAWMGHGAATEGAIGWLHLCADVLHTLAAAGWIGALVVFCLATRRDGLVSTSNLHAALAAFAGAGSLFVAAIILTGLVNSAFLVGWNIQTAAATAYGRVLAIKLVLFAIMLALAAVNRYLLSPALGRQVGSQPSLALGQLRRTIGTETAAAFLILAVASWLGTLPPVTAS